MQYAEIEMEVKTPIFIGSGKEIPKYGYAYIPKEKSIYVMNFNKLFRFLKEKDLLDQYEELIMQGADGKYRSNLMKMLKANRITESEIKEYGIYSYATTENDFEDISCKNIQEFVRDPYHMPYIPGSSLKGAIRTALIAKFVNENASMFESEKREIERIITNGGRNIKLELARQIKKIESKVFFTLERNKKNHGDMLNDCFCGLQISDSNSLTCSDITLCRKIDISPKKFNNAKRKLSVYRECLKPGTKVKFQMTIDETKFGYSIKELQEAIDFMNQQYHKNFLDSFEKYEIEKGTIYIGGGAGYATKTIMYLLFPREKAVELIAKFMQCTTPRQHNHQKDVSIYHVSPHMQKSTCYQNDWYDFGLCKLNFKPETF